MTWLKSFTPQQVNQVADAYHGQWMPEMDRCWLRKEDGVCVCSRLIRTSLGNVEHVTITRGTIDGKFHSDGSGDFSWAEKQQIKDELFGKNRVAVEVYPKEDRLVDMADVYHLWVFDKKFDLPFGIHPKEYSHAVNRGSMPLTKEEVMELKDFYGIEEKEDPRF